MYKYDLSDSMLGKCEALSSNPGHTKINKYINKCTWKNIRTQIVREIGINDK
jgi:hypothetical protein